MCFLKETGCLPLLSGKSYDSRVSLNQDSNRYGSQHSQNTLPRPLFWWNTILYHRSVFTQLWNCREICFLQPGNWGPKAKEVLSHCKTWIVASLPGKHTGLLFPSLQQQIWSIFWIFWIQQTAWHFFQGSHLTVQFYLIRVRIIIVHTQRTVSPNIFSQGMVHCVLGVSLHSSETAGKHVFVNLGIGAWWKKKYFPTVKTLSFPEKHTGSFFSSLQQIWLSFLIFWKQQVACQFLLGNHLIVHFHLIRVTTDMFNNTHWTLSPDTFSYGIVQCVLGVSLHKFETARKHAFVNLGIGVWWPKKLFPPS